MKSFKKIFTQLAIFAKLTISKLYIYLIVNGEVFKRSNSGEVKAIFILQTDEDFGVIVSPNIRSLDRKRWLSSEILK